MRLVMGDYLVDVFGRVEAVCPYVLHGDWRRRHFSLRVCTGAVRARTFAYVGIVRPIFG